MVDVKVWLAFALTEIILCLIPGPAVLLVIATAMRRGARQGIAAALGIDIGNTLYFGLSALGLGAILLSSYAAFTAVKYAGAAYLAYVGLRALFRRIDGTHAPSRAAGFAGGVVTQLANPKAIVFFAALLPQFVDAHVPVAPQMLVLGLTSLIIEIVVLGGYAIASDRAARTVRSERFATVVERAGGAFLLGAALKLAATRG